MILVACLVGPSPAQAQPVRPIAFAPAALEREALRAQILSDERQTQRERLAEARMRLAERLQAGDPKGIEDARRAVARIEDALDALGRELERAPLRVAVRPITGDAQSLSAQGSATAFTTARPAAPFVPHAPAPWWDVYGNNARPRGPATLPAHTDPTTP